MRENVPAELMSIEHYALQVRDDTIKDFDVKNAVQLQTALSQLQQLLAIKLISVSEGGINTQGQFQAFSVIKRVLDILVSAIQMARQRAAIETLILLRVALEASSTALHISRDQDAYQKYMIGKYDSPKAITFAKAVVPVIGEIYGHLSKAAVHTNQPAYGPHAKQDENGDITETLLFEFAVREHLPIQDAILLSFISLVAVVVLKMTELIMLEEDESIQGWLRLPGTRMRYVSNSDARILKFFDEIKRAPEMKEGRTVEVVG
jgi:hypothetical protein